MIGELDDIKWINDTPDREYHAWHQLIGNSDRNVHNMMGLAGKDSYRSLPGQTRMRLRIDESGFKNNKDKSVGVGQQFRTDAGASARSLSPKKRKTDTGSIVVCASIGSFVLANWKVVDFRDSIKNVLKGLFGFKTAYLWNRNTHAVENAAPSEANRKGRNGEKINYSFSDASLGHFTKPAVAEMLSLRFFVAHRLKKQKQILGMEPLQTSKRRSWHHQIAGKAFKPRKNTHFR